MKHHVFCISLIAGAMAASQALAQRIEVAVAATEPKELVCQDGTKFLYRWHEPATKEAGKKYPLVVLLHGAGERGMNNKSQLVWGGTPIVEHFKNAGEEFFLIAGQVPVNGGWVNVPWADLSHKMPKQPSDSMRKLIELISGLLDSSLPIDHDRIYATGVSMGGYGTWDLICRKPEWFAAAMPICGGGDVTQASKIKDIPIFIHHGDSDTAVPVWRSRAMIGALREAGSLVAQYTEYPGLGHNSWIPAYGNTNNLSRFFAQKRKAPAKWAAVDINAKEGITVETRDIEIKFEFSCDGGKNWKCAMLRNGVGFATPLVNGKVDLEAPFAMKWTAKNTFIVYGKSDCYKLALRNAKLRTL